MNALHFAIAGVGMTVRGEEVLTCSSRWRQFAADPPPPGLFYDLALAPCLPSPDGPVTYRTPRVQVAGGLRTYYNVETGRPVAAVRAASPNRWQITVLQELRPWAVAVEHLVEPFALPHALLSVKRLMCHCAYLDVGGRALLFLAPSGTGKTTQAELWQRCRGSTIVNGDRAALSLTPQGVMAWGLPISGSSPCCHNQTLPVAALVSLSQGRENVLTRLRGRAALGHLLRSVYLLPEFAADGPKATALAMEIVQAVPVYAFSCLPDETAVACLAQTIGQ